MAELVLTIIGRDRAGIVAALAEDIAFHGGNWQRSEMAEIAGTFAGVVVAAVPDNRVDELLASLVIMREHGVHITAELAADPVLPSAQEITLRVVGDDKPGVVSTITNALTEHGVSIARLGTVTDVVSDDGVPSFELTARLALPDDVAPGAVLDAIDTAADSLGVRVDTVDLTNDDDPR